MIDKFKTRNGLPRLRHRLTPHQASQRLKKIQRRRSERRITQGVRRDKWRRWTNAS